MNSGGYRINDPDVIYQLFDDEVVAINLASGAYHSLPGVAGDAFVLLGLEGSTLQDVAAELASRYDAPPFKIEEDLVPFFIKLEGESLITSVRPKSPSTRVLLDAPATARPYQPPDIQTHTDLQQLFLIDPIHDVTAAGWPTVAQPSAEEPAGAQVIGSATECQIAGSHIIFEKMGDETVIMDLTTGAYYSASGAAEEVFLLLQQIPCCEELRLTLESKYTASSDELQVEIETFLGELAAAKVVVLNQPDVPRCLRDLVFEQTETCVPLPPLRLTSFQEPPEFSGSPESTGTFRFRLRDDDVLFASVQGEMVLADRQSGFYYRMNQPVIDVLTLLGERSLKTGELVDALLAKYEATERNLTGAVMILLRHMTTAGLVVTNSGEQEATSPAATLVAPLLKPVFGGFHCELHKDLTDLMAPFNFCQPQPKSNRTSTAAWFVGSLCDYFAETARQMTERSLSIGGSSVCLRYATPLYADELTKAESHLEASPNGRPPDLVIHVWDALNPPTDRYFGANLARLLENWGEACGPRGELTGIHGEGVAALYHPGPDILSVLDVEHGQAYFLKRDQSPLPYWEIGSPFRYILHHWFARRGVQFVHAGAVGTDAGGVLLTGPSGSGKSTTTMLCARAGMRFAGDDYCLAHPETLYVYSLYNSCKLRGAEDLIRIPELTGLSRNPDSFENGGEGKGIYFLSEVWPDIWKERMSTGFPLRAIIVPKVTNAPNSRLERCSAADALLAMMPSTVAQLPTADGGDCNRLAALAEKLPAYHLFLGSDTERIPELVRRALTQ